MSEKRPIIAINYYFDADSLRNQIFDDSCNSVAAPFIRAFQLFMERLGVEVVTLNMVDFKDPLVKHVLYFDYNWRYALHDNFLKKIPYAKRALVLIEPANVNPTLYYWRGLRKQFATLFTWDWKLLSKNPAYVKINVPVGAEPDNYRENHFKNLTFTDKKFLVAISRNRWSYMPQSTYNLRKKAYRFFERSYPHDFDLFGLDWNSPSIFYERWFGYPRFKSWRGELPHQWEGKVQAMAHYKFALCFENNASQPGYISEKITDCFCARCVPIYYGSKGCDTLIPREAWIDLRDFRSFAALSDFLSSMNAETYQCYINAIDDFMQSAHLGFFSTNNLFQTIAKGLGCYNIR